MFGSNIAWRVDLSELTEEDHANWVVGSWAEAATNYRCWCWLGGVAWNMRGFSSWVGRIWLHHLGWRRSQQGQGHLLMLVGQVGQRGFMGWASIFALMGDKDRLVFDCFLAAAHHLEAQFTDETIMLNY